VCGCGRSGTTLTRVMLDSHPALFAGPESLLFLPTPIDPADLAFKFDIDRGEIEEMLRRTSGRAQFIDAFQRRPAGTTPIAQRRPGEGSRIRHEGGARQYMLDCARCC
jgi:hypothetical protein